MKKVTLKNILLSGDWIKLEIYPKVNKLWPECRFVFWVVLLRRQYGLYIMKYIYWTNPGHLFHMDVH